MVRATRIWGHALLICQPFVQKMCCIKVLKRFHNQQWAHLPSHASSLSSILGGFSQGDHGTKKPWPYRPNTRQFPSTPEKCLLYSKWCHFRTPFKPWLSPKTHQASLAHLHWSLPAQISGRRRSGWEGWLVWSYTVSRQPWCQCLKQNQQMETYDIYIYSVCVCGKHMTRLLQILGLWLWLYSC